MLYYDFHDSPHGQMLLVAQGEALTGVYFDGQKYHPGIAPEWRRGARHAPLLQAKRELAEYFGGERKRFDVALAPEGTAYQQSVWTAISTVGFGETIETPFPSLTTLFPGPAHVAALSPEQVARIGMPGARARTVIALARAVADGRLVLTPNADIEATLESLRALPGVGEWTAQYIAMRALAWPDAFPHTDLGVMKALRETSARRVLVAGDAWRPWRAYAVMHLWQSLTKE